MKTQFNLTRITFIFILIISMVFITCEETGDDAVLATFSIKNVSGPDKYTCGSFKWKVSFKLNKPSPKGGYFIQKLNIHRKATKICPTNYTEVNTTYYEAWKVNAGQSVTIYLQKDPKDYDDMFSWSKWIKSEGFHKMDGKLKFFEDKSLPADFKAKKVAYAGILPASYTKPSFWDDESGQDHDLDLTWDCCDETSATITTTPDFSAKPEVKKPAAGGKFFENVEPLKAWTSDTSYNANDNWFLLENASMLNMFSDDEIASCVKDYVEYYGGDLDALSKLFVMLRVIYNVPDSLIIGEVEYYGGWVWPTEDLAGSYIKLLWPLGWNEMYPAPVVSFPFLGYMGAPYDAIGEQAYFSENFGRRNF